jgi:DNA-directed RNA polymerase II subunit RPB1
VPRCEDDLTHKLAEILRVNASLNQKTSNGTGEHVIRELIALLQYHVTTYFDNTSPGKVVRLSFPDTML